jgi:hypothetical protein
VTVDDLTIATTRIRVRVDHDTRAAFDVPRLGPRTVSLHVVAGSTLVAHCIARTSGRVAEYLTTTPLVVEEPDGAVTIYTWDGVACYLTTWTDPADVTFWHVVAAGLAIRDVAL